MTVGFTGSRAGMTDSQRDQVWAWLLEASEAHHGDCIGADEQFHRMCELLGIAVVLHPCTIRTQRAFCEGAMLEKPEAQPLVRNRAIVAACDVLLAAPKEATEQRRGGTWATIRHARKVGRNLRVAAP